MTTTRKHPLVGPRADRSVEPQAEACATHPGAVFMCIRADLSEDVTDEHLLEYVSALLENRTPDMHEDIYDELCRAELRVVGRAQGTGRPLAAAAAVMSIVDAKPVQGMRVAS